MERAIHMPARVSLTATLLIVCGLMPQAAKSEEGLSVIQWKAAGLSPAAAVQTDPNVVLAAGGERHVVVQLDAIPSSGQRQGLKAGGLELLRYLGSSAYFAKVQAGDGAVASARAAGVRAAFEIERDLEVAPDAAARRVSRVRSRLCPRRWRQVGRCG